jgi:hypothetical protein
MSTTKLTVADAVDGNWEGRLARIGGLGFLDTTSGTVTYVAADVDHYNIPMSLHAQGLGYYCDIPANTPDGLWAWWVFNETDPAFDASPYLIEEIFVVSGEREDGVSVANLGTQAKTDVATAVLATPANKLVTDGGGSVTAATVDALGEQAQTDVATAVLATPANKLVTDGGGSVTAATVDALGEQAQTDVAAAILDTPANKLTTNESGEVIASNMRGTDDALLADNYTAPDNVNIGVAAGAATSAALAAAAAAEAAISADGKIDELPAASDIDEALTESHGEGEWVSSADADWTAAEKKQIRDALGVAGEKVAAAGGQLQTIGSKTALIGSYAMTITSPFDRDGVLELVQGDDWPAGYALQFTGTNYTGFPLTGGTSELILVPTAERDVGDLSNSVTFTGTVVQNVQTVVCTFVLTAAQLAALGGSPPAGQCNYTYQVIGVASDGKTRTLKLASATVFAKLSE